MTISRYVSESDVNYFWNHYLHIISKEKEEVWDALLSGLQTYYKALQGYINIH